MIWPIDDDTPDDSRDHGSRCGCEDCARDRHELRLADAADRAREDADEDRDIDAGACDDCDDIDF